MTPEDIARIKWNESRRNKPDLRLADDPWMEDYKDNILAAEGPVIDLGCGGGYDTEILLGYDKDDDGNLVISGAGGLGKTFLLNSAYRRVRDRGFDAARVVVELNEAIVPKACYGETVLRDGDQVEIVCFMGGG